MDFKDEKDILADECEAAELIVECERVLEYAKEHHEDESIQYLEF